MSQIIGTQEAILAVRFTLPPGTAPEAVAKQLSQGGVNLPLGLIQYVRKIDVALVVAGEPWTVPPPEDGGPKMVQ